MYQLLPVNPQTDFPVEVTAVDGTPVFIEAHGGALTSDAGVLLLRETEAQVEIIAAITNCLIDPQHPSHNTYSQETLLTRHTDPISQ